MKKIFRNIIFPSDIENYEGIEIDKKNELLNLKKEKGYYSFETFRLPTGKIRTFAVSERCSQIYMLDDKNNVYILDLPNENLHIKLRKFDYISFAQDCCIIGDLIIFAGDNEVSVFSLITWQKIWHSHTDFKIEKIRTDNSEILLIGEEKFAVFSKTGKEISKEEITPLDLMLKKEKSLNRYITGNVTSVYPLENTVFLSTDQYNDELGSVYIFDIKNNRFTFRDNIPIKKKVKKIYLDNSKNLYILAEGSLIYFPYDFLYAQEGLFSFSILSSTGKHQWHRLSIEGDIPDGSSVKVYLSTNTQKYAVFENSKDIYIPEGLKGKELNIKIVLNSDFSRKKSPVIRYISIFYPRKTYLDYLPQVYKEDAESKDILERYLSILQTVNQSLEKKIKDTPYLLDPLLADAEFLNWLSGWFGLERDGSLEEKRWREFLKEAYNLFKIKGTRKFFERLIEIFCDEKPYIIEPFQVEQCSTRKDINLKDEYSFCIFIKENKNIQTVRKLVNRFSPSHTEGKSMVMPEFILLGSFVLLGVNSFIHKPLPVLEKGLINIDSYLEDTYTGSRIEQKSRLSIDTKLDI